MSRQNSDCKSALPLKRAGLKFSRRGPAADLQVDRASPPHTVNGREIGLRFLPGRFHVHRQHTASLLTNTGVEKKSILATIALLALIAAAVVVLVNQTQRGPKTSLKPYQALGAVTAEETAKLVGNHGLIAVIAEDFGRYNMAWVKVQMSSFKSTLEKNGVALAKIEKVIHPELSEGQGQAFTAEVLLRLIQNHPPISGVVIFAALPPFSDQDLSRLQRYGKKIVVVSKTAIGYRTLLESGVIHVAIITRPEAPSDPEKKPKTPRDLFDKEYVVVTRANLAELPQ